MSLSMTPEAKVAHDLLLNKRGYLFAYINESDQMLFYKPDFSNTAAVNRSGDGIIQYGVWVDVSRVERQHQSNSNGWRKNWEKVKDEFDLFWWPTVRQKWKDLLTFKGGVGHTAYSFVDIFVESRRASPYISGYLGAFLVPLGIACFIFTCFILGTLLL